MLIHCLLQLILCWGCFSQFDYNEYLNENYTIFSAIGADTSTDFIPWQDAEDFCSDNLGANLASYHNDIDSNSFLNLATSYSVDELPIWFGAYDTTTGATDLFTGWIWIDGTEWNNYTLWADGQPSHDTQQCSFWRSDEFGTWGDYRCDGGVVPSNNLGHCTVFACNTPILRTYTITIHVANTPSNANTIGNIWFRIKGTISQITDSSQSWTDWFDIDSIDSISNGFDTIDTNYTFSISLTNVGLPSHMIILTQQNDSFTFDSININTIYDYKVNLDTPQTIAYPSGPSETGCNYVLIDITDGNITEFTYDTECPFDSLLPTTEPTLRPTSIPSNEPTNMPTNIPTTTITTIATITTTEDSGGPNEIIITNNPTRATTTEVDTDSLTTTPTDSSEGGSGDGLGDDDDNGNKGGNSIFENIFILVICAIGGLIICALFVLAIYCYNLRKMTNRRRKLSKMEKEKNNYGRTGTTSTASNVGLSTQNPYGTASPGQTTTTSGDTANQPGDYNTSSMGTNDITPNALTPGNDQFTNAAVQIAIIQSAQQPQHNIAPNNVSYSDYSNNNMNNNYSNNGYNNMNMNGNNFGTTINVNQIPQPAITTNHINGVINTQQSLFSVSQPGAGPGGAHDGPGYNTNDIVTPPGGNSPPGHPLGPTLGAGGSAGVGVGGGAGGNGNGWTQSTMNVLGGASAEEDDSVDELYNTDNVNNYNGIRNDNNNNNNCYVSPGSGHM